jgi:histidine ammonia-lyase
MCLRINNAIRNHSAVRKEVALSIAQLLNKDIVPWIPERGTISASGDLVPLSYLATLLSGKPYALAYIPD